ncbi:MAG: DUF898 family protein [Planktomarina sp.]
METDIKHTTPVYVGSGSGIFMLALKTGFLTLITLGIYRFWAKTRIRRFVWSSIKVDGDTAEYTGTGLEKLLGFLVAVVVLAVYLGLLQVVLTFVGLSLMGAFANPDPSPEAILAQLAVTYITVIALLPLILFAQYRGRRYMLSRTRWRGLRLGMTPGALGFVWRGLVYTVLTIVSLGLLLPLATFRLQKYMVDRTWFGDAPFAQSGKWTGLYHGMKHIFIAVAILIATGVLVAYAGEDAIWSFIVGYLWLMFGFVDYQVKSYRYMTDRQTVDDEIGFTTDTQTSAVAGTYVVGALATGLLGAILFGIFFLLLRGLSMSLIMSFGIYGIYAFVVVFYIAILVILGAVAMAVINQPILAIFVRSTTIVNSGHLANIQQRADDSIADADGFADALDVGGAF